MVIEAASIRILRMKNKAGDVAIFKLPKQPQSSTEWDIYAYVYKRVNRRIVTEDTIAENFKRIRKINAAARATSKTTITGARNDNDRKP